MIKAGIILGFLHISFFLIFYLLDVLPDGRSYLIGFNLAAFVLTSTIMLKQLATREGLQLGKALVVFFGAFTISSVLNLTFDHTFNNYIDKDYKFILAAERVEQINNRRAQKGVGNYEVLDREKIEDKHSFSAAVIAFRTSCIVNVVFALAFSGVFMIIRKSGSKEGSYSHNIP
jgi:hypothetical protein